MASITFENLTKKYDDLTAVNDLNLSVNDGEFYVMLGPTGAGKTTSLRCLSGLDKDYQGSVYIGNSNVTDWSPAHRDVAMVFQQYSLYPHLTVRENLEFPLKSKIRMVPQDEIERRVNYAAATLKIVDLLDRKTDKLSGGEMQRVSIGRAIVRKPKVFLMDEPLSSLDAKLREALRIELKRLQKELGATLIYVTHDQVEAMSMADRVGIIKEGQLIQSDTPHKVYNEPKNTFVAGFVGSPKINFFDGIVENGRLTIKGSPHQFQLESEILEKIRGITGELIIGVRPEDIFLTHEAQEGACEAKVYVIEHMGMENLISFHIDPYHFKAATDSAFEVNANDKIYFRFAQEKLHFFDKNSEENLV
ncbi:MAG: ABC transporter ATP-binding protein [SAR324 cluster bacterium]|nr:ABC transporter ATP-binding protein [SAR324 cluster bacterium]